MQEGYQTVGLKIVRSVFSVFTAATGDQLILTPDNQTVLVGLQGLVYVVLQFLS